MTWTPTEPDWASPSRTEIADLHWLAYRAQLEMDSPWAAGVAAAVSWVRGGRVAPVTERDDTPVTKALAEAEMWAAVVALGDGPPPPVEGISARLGVPYRAPCTTNPDWAQGVWRALRWLTGTGGQVSPIALPVRHTGGSVPTADELFDLAVAVAPQAFRQPEERIALRDRVEANARRYRELADLVEDTKRRVPVV